MCAELLGTVEHDGSSSKTSEAYSVLMVGTLWPKSLRHWPQTGSLRSGRVYGRPTLERPTSDCDGSALATPTAWLGRRPSQAVGDPDRWENPERSNELSDQIAHLVERLLPTPTARDHKDGAPCDVPVNALLGRAVWSLHGGDPTPTPSPNGNQSSGDQHPNPPTTNGD